MKGCGFSGCEQWLSNERTELRNSIGCVGATRLNGAGEGGRVLVMESYLHTEELELHPVMDGVILKGILI